MRFRLNFRFKIWLIKKKKRVAGYELRLVTTHLLVDYRGWGSIQFLIEKLKL